MLSTSGGAMSVVALQPTALSSSNLDAGYRCSVCPRVFRRQAACRRHEHDAHSDADDSGRHRCAVCGKTFASRATLASHRAVHDDAVDDYRLRAAAFDRPNVDDESSLGGTTAVEDCCVDDEICLDEDGAEMHVAAHSPLDLIANDNNNDQKEEIQRFVPAEVVEDSTTKKPADLRLTAVSAVTAVAQRNNVLLCRTAAAADVLGGPGSPSTAVDLSRKRRLSGCNGGARVEMIKPKIFCRGTAASSLSPASPSLVGLRQDEALQRTLEARRQSAEIIMTTSTANVGEERKLTGTIVSVNNGVFTTSAVAQQQPPQKIIVYVKTESSITQQQQQQQLNIEPTSNSKSSTTSGQFVCPVCLRDFTTEKYLSMHISSIHKTLTTADGVNLDATAIRRIVAVSSSSSTDVVRPALDTVTVGSAAHTAGIVWSQCSLQQQQQQLVVTTQVTSTPLVLPASAATSKTQWTCHICNKTFAQNSSYKNHVRTHSDDRPYVCSICSIGFKERYHLKKHALFKHTTDLNETCRVCGKKFKDSTAVRAHERIHSDVRPYGCTLCGKTFKTSECLWHHENRSKTCGKMAAAAAAAAGGVDRLVRLKPGADQPVPAGHRRQRRATTVGSPGIFVSRQQQATGYATVEKVASTVLVSSTDVDLKPEVVQRSHSSQSPSVVVLQREEEDIPELEIKPRIAAAVNRRSPPCPVVQHIDDETSVTIKTEPDCELFDVNLNAMFESEDQSFEDFWQNFDLDTTPDNTDETSSTTETASSSPETTDSETTAADEALLLKDLVSAASTATASAIATSGPGGSLTSSKRFDCTRCEKRFASATTLEKHLLVHAEIRPYRCTLCDIGFKLKVHLKKHNLYRHSEEYPCECSICGKRFKDSSAVRLHERIHSSDRPFQCTHCGKSFKTRENLWGHRNRGPCDKSLLNASAQSASTMSTAAPAATDAVHCGGTGADVTQRFVANNIRLFHSAEFGPILGVPVSATKLVLKEVRGGKSVGRTSTACLDSTASILSLSMGADRKPLGTSNIQLINVSSSGIATTVASGTLTASSLSYLPQRVSAIRLGQQMQARTSVSTLSTLSVPTAVVTPIKRETIQSTTAPITAAAVMQKFASTSPAFPPSSISTVVVSRPSVVRPSTLFEPDMRKRSKSASVADQCPTVQKFLALGSRSADTVSRFPGINKILETTPSPSSSQQDADALLNNNNNDDDFSSVENNLNDAINVLSESIMSESGAMLMDGDSLVDGMTGADVDWPLVDELGTPLVGGRLNKVDGGHWTNLMATDQLLNSTDEDDLSEDSFSDYQFMPPSPSTLGSDGQEVTAVQSGNHDVKFDTNDFITPTSDAMWCDWPPENDLNSLLMFGP